MHENHPEIFPCFSNKKQSTCDFVRPKNISLHFLHAFKAPTNPTSIILRSEKVLSFLFFCSCVCFCFPPEMRTLFTSPEKKNFKGKYYASCGPLNAAWRRRELKHKTNGFSSWGGGTTRHLISDMYMQLHGPEQPKKWGRQRAVNAWLSAWPAGKGSHCRQSLVLRMWLRAVFIILCSTSLFEQRVKYVSNTSLR
jgi:hypothetical protein